MDLRLREMTWVRLVTLLLWTILMMLQRGITQLIDVIEGRVFDRVAYVQREGDQGRDEERGVESATLLPPPQ